MDRIFKIAAALLTAGTVLLLCGCTELMEQAGMNQEQIDRVEQVYEDAKVQVSEGMGELSDQMNVAADRLGALLMGSDQAYGAMTGLYANTRLAAHYDKLDANALDAATFQQTDGDGEQAYRLCRITGLFGAKNPWYAQKNPYAEGLDTWYCYGRFGEDHNIALGAFDQQADWLEETDAWVRTVYAQKNPDADMQLYGVLDGYLAAGVFVSRDARKIYPHSIAVYDTADQGKRVLYIEDVRYVEGVPVKVYFSEADEKGQAGALDQWDGVLQVMDMEPFLQSRNIEGYIVPLNMFS